MFKRLAILALLPAMLLLSACQEMYLDGVGPNRTVCEYVPVGVAAKAKLRYSSAWYVDISYIDNGVSRTKSRYSGDVTGLDIDALKKDGATQDITGCLKQATNKPQDLIPAGQTAFVDKVYVWVETYDGYSERFVEVRMTYGATSVRWLTVNPGDWDDWKNGKVLRSGQQIKADKKGEPTL
ncbi:MAG: hypothetical protein GC134_09625 [Proteobacteria bacterium]|nr:hypothetical protein [Pseudomonadota bacterium]